METIIKKPKDCSESEINIFCNMVQQGDEVTAEGLRPRILRAEKLIFITDKKCVAVGAIKNPNKGYKDRIFNKAKATGSDQYLFELGWIFVDPNVRRKRLGQTLMNAIMENLLDKKCYATIRENNGDMLSLLEKFHFLQLGQSYKSDNGNYALVIYAKP